MQGRLEDSSQPSLGLGALGAISLLKRASVCHELDSLRDSGVTAVPSVILGTERRGEHTYSF